MNIVVSKTAAKLSVAFVAVAMLFTLAMPAQAQTLEELQDMIATLQQQIAALTGGGSSTSCPALTQPMTIGSDGQNVVALQNYLTSTGHFTFSGGSTGYFGSITQSAVASWQAANGVSPAAGYWGPISLAKYNAVCTTDGGDTDGGSMSGDLEGGAGDIDVNQTSSGVEDEVLEGEDDVEVLGFDIEADDSDVEITSVRVEFEYEGSSAGSDNLDRYIDEVTIWMDGEMVGSADVDEFDEDNDIYSENIALDDAVIRDGDEKRFYVAVTAENNIDSDDVSKNWEVALGQVRFRDGSGAVLTDSTGDGALAGSSDGAVAETFTFEDLSTAGDVQITVREDDDDVNDAHTVQVDTTSDTNDVEILSFTLEAEGSDMVVNQLIFDITSSGAGVTEIANDFRLLMDGEEVGDVSYDLDQNNTGGESSASTSDAAIALIFSDLDDEDVEIDEDDEVTFTLVADINDTEGGFTNGDSLSASLTGDTTDVDADDENGDSVTDVTGSAESTTIGFASTGIMVQMTDSSASQVLGLDSTSTDDQGKYVVEFEVTAFEDTAYVELEAASSTEAVTSNYGVAFNVETTANATVADGTNTASLERISGGSISGNYVKINAGQTATLRLTVYYNPASTGIYRVQMNAVGFAATAIAATSEQATVPVEDYQSSSVQVQN